MTINCPECNTSNPSDSKYCKQCATSLPSAEDIKVTETMEAAQEELTTGSTFAERYQVIEELGKGGMDKNVSKTMQAQKPNSYLTVWSDGRLTLNFGWLYDTENTLQRREKLRDELKGIKSISAYIPKSLENKYPILPPKAWTPIVDDFISILTKLLKEK